MAECKTCGKTYFSRECPHCKNSERANNTNTSFSESIIKQSITDSVLGKNKTPKLIPAIFMTLIAIVILTFIIQYNTNPLIGKWRGHVTLLGTQTIEFRKDRVVFMGITSKVEYEKSGDEVIVTDATGIGTIYKIIDKNTIFCNAVGLK